MAKDKPRTSFVNVQISDARRNGDGIEKIDEVRQVEKTLLSFWLKYDTGRPSAHREDRKVKRIVKKWKGLSSKAMDMINKTVVLQRQWERGMVQV